MKLEVKLNITGSHRGIVESHMARQCLRAVMALESEAAGFEQVQCAGSDSRPGQLIDPSPCC